MPTARGIACSLKIEGRGSSVEYGSQFTGDFASAFVVAEEGQRFSLEVATTKWIHSGWRLFVYIDGVYQTGHIHSGSSRKDFSQILNFDHKSEFEEGNRNIAFKKVWRFDKLPVVDMSTADCQKDPRVLSNLGTIEIVFIRCDPSGSYPRQLPHPTVGSHQYAKPYWKSYAKDRQHVVEKPAQPVFEKDIKGRDISHRVTTEPEKQTGQHHCAKGHPIDTFDYPYCIIVMHYRSRESLQNMGLIPFTPVPSPSRTASLEVTQEDLEQIKRLSREQMMQELLKYRKLESVKPDPEFKRKREVDGGVIRGTKRGRTGSHTEKVVIDLTGD